MDQPFTGYTFQNLQKGNYDMNGLGRSLSQLAAASGVAQDRLIADPHVAQLDGEGVDQAGYNPGEGAISRELATAMLKQGYAGISDQMVGPRDHQVYLDKANGQRDMINQYRTGKHTFWDQFAEHLPGLIFNYFAPGVGKVVGAVEKDNLRKSMIPGQENNAHDYVAQLKSMLANVQANSDASVSTPHRTNTDPVQQSPMVPNFQNNMLRQKMLMAMLLSGGTNRSSGA